MKEEHPPWAFLLIAGDQRPGCYDSMHSYSSNFETVEDWEFLYAADKNVDETLEQRQTLDNNNNNINYCLKGNGLLYMDGNYTRGIEIFFCLIKITKVYYAHM